MTSEERVEELTKQRDWLFQLLEFAHGYMGACGCCQKVTDNHTSREIIWHRKAGGVLDYVREHR